MLQRPQERSVVADIAVEDLEGVIKELPPLFIRYERELDGRLAADPDWHSLLRQSAMGCVVTVTVRHEEVLVGFAVNVFYPHVTHRNVPHCTILWIWLDPAYREGVFGRKFLQKNIDFIKEKFASLKMEGPKRIMLGTPDERAATMYERLGFKFCEAIYEMVL